MGSEVVLCFFFLFLFSSSLFETTNIIIITEDQLNTHSERDKITVVVSERWRGIIDIRNKKYALFRYMR
jgi:hypothetical protein